MLLFTLHEKLIFTFVYGHIAHLPTLTEATAATTTRYQQQCETNVRETALHNNKRLKLLILILILVVIVWVFFLIINTCTNTNIFCVSECIVYINENRIFAKHSNNKASLTYLQHPRPHNKWKAISSTRNVQVPNVTSMNSKLISKSDKIDVEMLSASLSHRTLSIVPIALRRLLHLYCLPFRPCTTENILYFFEDFFFFSLPLRYSVDWTVVRLLGRSRARSVRPLFPKKLKIGLLV